MGSGKLTFVPESYTATMDLLYPRVLTPQSRPCNLGLQGYKATKLQSIVESEIISIHRLWMYCYVRRENIVFFKFTRETCFQSTRPQALEINLSYFQKELLN